MVQAHFTLGDLTGTAPFHANDFDPHVSGAIGYVWPGSGQNAYSGFPNIAQDNLAPGYQSPYPDGNPPGAPSNSWYQLESNSYSPFGAVLTGSTGDLIFAINATCTSFSPPLTGPSPTSVCSGVPNEGWDTLAIYIPTGFVLPGASQVVSTISNDYAGYYVNKAGPFDRYGPGWSVVYVQADTITNARNVADAAVGTAPPEYYNHQFINFTAAREWYYVRINGVRAPLIAGRYFFKIALLNTINETFRFGDCLGGEEGVCGVHQFGEQASQFIPTENWPVMLVKGELDPAIITGMIRYGGYNQTLYGLPVQEAGEVYAKMTTRLDPYTGQTRLDLPTIDAVGFFNSTAQGHYEIEGLAPGVYDLYASAAGYPKRLIANGVTVLRGQSLHFDGYVLPGPVIEGSGYSKHQFGDEPWPEADPTGASALDANTYIKIEIYDQPTLSHIPLNQSALVSWSPLPCIAGGQEDYRNGGNAGSCGDPRLGGEIAFPWHEYTPKTGYFAGSPPSLATSISCYPDVTGPVFYEVATGCPDGDGSGHLTQDPQGVGPPQHWYVQGGTTIPFFYQFGSSGEYGAPTDLNGMVPQLYATWVDGLAAGRFCVRAWVFRYVQATLDGSTFQDYCFTTTPAEWAGAVQTPIDLRLSSWVNETLHFLDHAGSLTQTPIDTGAGLMSGVLTDANGNVWSYNQTILGYKGCYSDGAASGEGALAFSKCVGSTFASPGLFARVYSSTTVHGNDLDKAGLNAHAIESGSANIQFWGWNDTWGGENYGIPAGTYEPHVFVLGYLDDAPQVSTTLSGNPTSVSDVLLRGVGFNLTIYSIDWERPSVIRNWVWGNPTGYLPFQGFSKGTVAGGCGTSGQVGSPPNRCLVGQEIDVGFYANGMLVNVAGDTPWHDLRSAPDTIKTSCLYQNYTASEVEMCGGGWNPNKLASNGAYIPYQGDANGAFFGVDLGYPGYVGGYTDKVLITEAAEMLFGPAHYNATVVTGTTQQYNIITSYVKLYPTAMPPGVYDLRAFTYGYIQDERYSAYGSIGQVLDMRVNLLVGANVTLDILFKKENIITPTSTNMSARVRLFDDTGNLVAEWMSSEGTYTPADGLARAADATTQYPFGNLPAIPSPEPLNTYHYLPGGITILHVLMAGLPGVPGGGQQVGPEAYDGPKGTYYGDPAVWETLPYVRSGIACGFGIDCFANPGPSWNGLGFFPNYGIPAAPDYTGGWTAEVDFVNWYSNNTGSTPAYYPPAPGLLEGESYHVIPGTTANSIISLTEDLALRPVPLGVGQTLARNHFGPYSQEGVWQIAGTHNSGEASAIFEVDLNGFISGNVLGFTYANEFRTQSWDTISVVGSTGATLPSMYTFDGVYQAFFSPGSYSFTINAPGYTPQTWSISVTPGETGTGQNIYLQQSQIPVPEFGSVAVIVLSAIASLCLLLRRRPK